ncbi:threonine aldolase family protein [Bacilliculturomica massiliensis]|uniref:threonine aldolase family protein n=1 Tax=Bacilliculturomica massiliensis TaxID=1917867 RepID=UPI001030F1D1|nr:low specificity L-threonine aldolase [Bacilliculturomica massiliensis]
MRYIDLRSDSVTMPTPEMRRAMYETEVGYDVLDDDPAVHRLERMAAEMTGKEAAAFIPTGTMCNQLAIMCFTRPGEEIILSADSHILDFEGGAAAALSGAMIRAVPTEDGILRASHIRDCVRPADDIHAPRTGLVCMENALGRGTVVPLERMREVYETASELGIPVHTDGARLFNAAAVLSVDIKEMAQYTDSLAVGLSKGLCAPVGSVLAGSRAFVAAAKKNRQKLGGGLSQAGVLAAPGMIALEKMTGRIAEDHENARYMAELLEAIPGVTVDRDRAQINLVFFRIDREKEILEGLPDRMLEKGVKIGSHTKGVFRFVTHNDVSRADVEEAAAILRELLQAR